MPAFDHFGEYLKSLRQKEGLTQNELAKTIGKSGMYISNIEKGKNLSPPRQDDLAALADRLGLGKNRRNKFFELAAADRSTLPKAMVEYIFKRPSLRELIWAGYEKDFSNRQWQKLTVLMISMGLMNNEEES